MGKDSQLFNRISGVYGLFFNWQVNRFRNIFKNLNSDFDFSAYQSAIDVGCGTGALCKALDEWGLSVTGVDSAEKMLAIARKKAGTGGKGSAEISFVHGDVLAGLPFQDKEYDIAVSSYVAHGLKTRERSVFYREMKRVAREAVVLFEYNEKRSVLSDIAEAMEGGDYFNFIKVVKEELVGEFGNLKVIQTGKRSALYICKIK